MSDTIVGIDISKKDLSIAIIIGSQTYQINVSNDKVGFKKFSKWLKENKVTKIKACMEAMGAYGICFANYLHEQNHEVSIVNPVRISAFTKSKLTRHKTDFEQHYNLFQEKDLKPHFCAKLLFL